MAIALAGHSTRNPGTKTAIPRCPWKYELFQGGCRFTRRVRICAARHPGVDLGEHTFVTFRKQLLTVIDMSTKHIASTIQGVLLGRTPERVGRVIGAVFLYPFRTVPFPYNMLPWCYSYSLTGLREYWKPCHQFCDMQCHVTLPGGCALSGHPSEGARGV